MKKFESLWLPKPVALSFHLQIPNAKSLQQKTSSVFVRGITVGFALILRETKNICHNTSSISMSLFLLLSEFRVD